MIKFYYGMSGTFKATTIERDLRDNLAAVQVYSMIKPWKHLESGVFKDYTTPNHLNFAMLHLCNLEHTLLVTKSPLFLIERGVTDAMFYWSRDNGGDEETIHGAVEEEMRLIDSCGEVEKILLVQKDEDFIDRVILREKTRSDVFRGGIKDYLRDQERYVEFTKKYNNITKVIEINNAREYIENLGLVYNETK